MQRILVSRDNPLEYVKASACGHFDVKDKEVFIAFMAAEEALEEGESNATELFDAFCALLDARGIVVTALVLSRSEEAEERDYKAHCAKRPKIGRGIAY